MDPFDSIQKTLQANGWKNRGSGGDQQSIYVEYEKDGTVIRFDIGRMYIAVTMIGETFKQPKMPQGFAEIEKWVRARIQ
jgi:hypothetical protein